MSSSVITFDGLESAYIGVATVWHSDGNRVPRAIYSGPALVEHFVATGLTEDEAHEYIDFNVEGGYVGPSTPIVVWPAELKELDS